jgi:hypothetical protein
MVNKFLQVLIDSGILNEAPGFGLGQTLKSIPQVVTEQVNQQQADVVRQQQINDLLSEADYIKQHGIKPDPNTYKKVQNQYQTMSNDQLQTAKDIESVRNQGLESLGNSALTLLLVGQDWTPINKVYSTGSKMPKVIFDILKGVNKIKKGF